MFTLKDNLFVNFFCQIVAVVAPIRATIEAIIPKIGIDFPTSNPITNIVPINPSKIPIHWVKVTFSFKMGPLKMLVNTGCNPTINADRVADKPTLYEKNTPPK